VHLNFGCPGVLLNAGDLITKTGAGNCGEMALLSRDIINKSDGRAYAGAAGDAQSFTVIDGTGKSVFSPAMIKQIF
jgi:hypothetical protein